MRREPSLTLSGALEILGRHERPVIEKLDRMLGGAILVAGAAAGLHTVGGFALGPIGLWSAIWGWTEQKNAAFELLRKAVDSVTGKLNDSSKYERGQLIAAAHTTIVVGAYFEALREEVGAVYDTKLKISDAEKAKLISGRVRQKGDSLIELLYKAEVPAQSPSLGFEDNISRVRAWMAGYGGRFAEFTDELKLDNRFGTIDINWLRILDKAIERYRSWFLELAAKVPEFAIWSILAEHEATRTFIKQHNAELTSALGHNEHALARVETMLALTVRQSILITDLRAVLQRANRRVLNEPIIVTDSGRHGLEVTFPIVSDVYINPRFRAAQFDIDVRPADENWWDKQASRAEFDLFLAAYVTTPKAMQVPMLLLGDPGAGKSLLTKVLAARLPASGYSVVRVQLRRVGANAPVGHQIQTALDEATTERVSWAQLSDQSVDTTRVVLLDGLDELLQASGIDRSGYLQEVMEFQEIEAAQERPIIVIVTSRTVVADRVDIPNGATVVKLDTFVEEDVADWLQRWRSGNADAIAKGKVRALTLEAALRQPELARQPLLLLMLAVYTADPMLPELTAGLSTAGLYARLLEEFARREARKTLGDFARGRELDEGVREHLDRLAIAALAMFNRGRQDISEEELGRDISVLDERLMSGRDRYDEAGKRVIGEFFFVHAPEARMLTTVNASENQPRRTYEFLHATFGEYLVARYVMQVLSDVVAQVFAGRRGPADPQDNLLFALLSHQPLAARKSTLIFAGEVFENLSKTERRRTLDVLEMMLETYRDRHGSDLYVSYRPMPSDTVRQLANYSANLVSLRAVFEPGGKSVPLAKLLRTSDGTDGLLQWRSMVMLWQSGLDADGMQALLSTLVYADAKPAIRMATAKEWLGEEEVLIARLVGDREMERRMSYGVAIFDGRARAIHVSSEGWLEEVSKVLIPLTAGAKLETWSLPEIPTGLREKDIQAAAALIFNYFKTLGHRKTDQTAGRRAADIFMELLFKLPKVFEFDGYALARAVILMPSLLESFSELRQSEIYGRFFALIEQCKPHEIPGRIESRDWKRTEHDASTIMQILAEIVEQQTIVHEWER